MSLTSQSPQYNANLRIVGVKVRRKNTLRALVSVNINTAFGGLEIRDVPVHFQNGKKYALLPAREMPSGGFVAFMKWDSHETFSRALVNELDITHPSIWE